MRFAAAGVGLALILSMVSSVGLTRRPDNQLNPVSVTLLKQAQGDIAANRLDVAVDTLETALAVDPRNRQAYIELAAIARKQQLPGKAVRFYREALLLEPNDVSALAGQGEALIQKGAVTKAKDNLTRIQKICATACPEQKRLAMAIDTAATKAPIVATQAVTPKPIVTETPTPKP